MKKAYQNNPYLSPTQYALFLKKTFLGFDARYYVAASAAEVETTDGPMYAVHITQDIENPALEPVGEVFINNEYVYLWREHFWRVAVTNRDKPIIRYVDQNEITNSNLRDGWFKNIPPVCNKVLLIYRVGSQAIE